MEPLYIIGPQRSGTTILAALLDDHPDIAVWPREWRFFTTFWDSVPGESDRKRTSDITRAAMPAFRKAAAQIWHDRIGEYRNMRVLDLDALVARLDSGANDTVSAAEYVIRLGEAYAGAHCRYASHPPRYFAMKTMMSGIDWSNASFLDGAKTLFTVRSLSASYQSYKSRFFLKKVEPGISSDRRVYQYFRDWCFALLYFAKQSLDVRRRLEASDNNKIVALNEIKHDHARVMEEIARFLGIVFSESMLAPSFLGAGFSGHFHDKTLNSGRIINDETAYPDLSPFEIHYLDRLVDSYDSGRPLTVLGPISDRWAAAYSTAKISTPSNAAFRALAFGNMLAVDWRMRGIWRKDLAQARHDRTLLERPSRGLKTRLMRSLGRGAPLKYP